ncbi:MAG: DNA repair protein RadA, partial [Bacteroidaceae bacterium]|nr:DNA repair protein RadA [Bacteroidaceae bacterium]
MAKDKTAYVCENCGQESVKWLGKCPACNQWGTMKEIKIGPSPSSSRGKSLSLSTQQRPTPQQLHNIETSSEPRIDMGDGELNRVLGGGLVPGSLVLL